MPGIIGTTNKKANIDSIINNLYKSNYSTVTSAKKPFDNIFVSSINMNYIVMGLIYKD